MVRQVKGRIILINSERSGLIMEFRKSAIPGKSNVLQNRKKKKKNKKKALHTVSAH